MAKVAKATVFENIYKEFYDLIVAISGYTSIVFPTYPDKIKGASSDYPIVIINSPEISDEAFTFAKNKLTGTIDIEIYTTTAKDTDVKASEVRDKIETSKFTLATAGLQRVDVESTVSDMAPHGDIKVFQKVLTFKYTFTSAKTRAF